MQRPKMFLISGIACILLLLNPFDIDVYGENKPPAEREISPGYTTRRVVEGVPLELTGKRLVFTNWHYIQPGDLDWRNDDNKSVYVHGDEAPAAAHHIGIRAPHGIRIMAVKPVVEQPAERPHRMIIQDGATYKAWTDSDYYESTDARHWQRKAALDLPDGKDFEIYQVFLDPSAPVNERYKSVGTGSITHAQFDEFRKSRPDGWEPRAMLHFGENDQLDCIRGRVSGDGIHWRTLPEPLCVNYSDTWNTAYYDAVLGEYVIYTRYWSVGALSSHVKPDVRNNWTGFGRRAIGRTASKDFREFNPAEMILEPTTAMLPSEQLYTNCYTTVPGAPDQHLMFPSIWNGSIDDTTRIAMASSHDGKIWDWVPNGELLDTAAFGNWNGGCVWATPNLIELPNGDWALPYLAHTLPHKYPRGKNKGSTSYAVWPKGRMCAVVADDAGEFTMQPLIAAGTKLRVNAVTLRTGSIRFEVVGTDGRNIDACAPIVGDQHWTAVSWNGKSDLGIEKGKPVTLRVTLKQAKLFGLEFE